jgi:hypothetical protein
VVHEVAAGLQVMLTNQVAIDVNFIDPVNLLVVDPM